MESLDLWLNLKGKIVLCPNANMSSLTTPIKVEKTQGSPVVSSTESGSSSKKGADEPVSNGNKATNDTKSPKETAKENNTERKGSIDDNLSTKVSGSDGAANKSSSAVDPTSNRNPLKDNETNRNKSWSNADQKAESVQKQSPNNNTNSINNNNNNSKLRARPTPKKSTSPTNEEAACHWCSDKKDVLKYVMPTLAGENLEFCSESCITEFRKAVKKGACNRCGNAVRPSVAPNREYCSTYCMNKSQPKHGKLSHDEKLFCELGIMFLFLLTVKQLSYSGKNRSYWSIFFKISIHTRPLLVAFMFEEC